MNRIETLSIQLEESWVWEGLAPPEDPLEELSDFEMGLQRFCFERNHRVSIEIGSVKLDVFLDPDIALIIDGLPQDISNISLGRKTEIGFPESSCEIEFVPMGNEINCTLHRYGRVIETKHFLLEQIQVSAVLERFLTELVRLAVDGDYISAEQGREFLARLQNE